MVGFVMNKDSALRICNSIYSMMLGFTVNNMLLINKDWANYSMTLTCLSSIFICYYIIDWFSFNALATIDKTQESIEIFVVIVFVIILGWLTVFANNLAVSNTNSFILYSSIYLVISALLFLLRLNTTMEEKWNIDLKKDKFIVLDFLVRLILGVIGILSTANKSNEIVNDSTIKIWLPIFATVILLVKIIRYLDLVKIIKEQETTK